MASYYYFNNNHACVLINNYYCHCTLLSCPFLSPTYSSLRGATSKTAQVKLTHRQIKPLSLTVVSLYLCVFVCVSDEIECCILHICIHVYVYLIYMCACVMNLTLKFACAINVNILFLLLFLFSFALCRLRVCAKMFHTYCQKGGES